eukprot:scaffold8194_cov248-Pinguiococcus_pyrenoidosus.AAC.6
MARGRAVEGSQSGRIAARQVCISAYVEGNEARQQKERGSHIGQGILPPCASPLFTSRAKCGCLGCPT